MSRFKIGQKVVCLKSGNDLKEGVVHSVKDNIKCGCGVCGVSVNKVPEYVATDCKCGNELGGCWWNENLFAPLESDGCSKELAETMVKHLGGVKKEEIERLKI